MTSWNRAIDWANTLDIPRLSAAGPIPATPVELARVTENSPAVWQVNGVIQRASMGGGAAADMVITLRLTCGNGRVTWIQDHPVTIPAADFAAADFAAADVENRSVFSIQIAAKSISVGARFVCVTATATLNLTATIAPVGWPG